MSEFINTIDILGDDAVIDSIIDRSITEFKDDTLTFIGTNAFAECDSLELFDAPNVTSVGSGIFSGSGLVSVSLPSLKTFGANQNVFANCTSLKNVNLPSLENMVANAFTGCSAIEEIHLPLVKSIGTWSMQLCKSLKIIDMPLLNSIGQGSFYNCTSLEYFDAPFLTNIGVRGFDGCTKFKALILRSTSTVTLGNTNALDKTPIASGVGYIYVPSTLIDSYKVATNWSTYASQLRAIEDYSVDGTADGLICTVTYNLKGVTTSNADIVAKTSYSTKLTPISNLHISSITITMDGEDITNSVYDGNGNISITSVTGDIVINATATKQGQLLLITPYDDLVENDLPKYRLDVSAGQTLELTYYLTKIQGYIYDGRGCGLWYILRNNVIYAETTITVTIPEDGYIVFSGLWASAGANGELASSGSDRLYGQYLIVSEI